MHSRKFAFLLVTASLLGLAQSRQAKTAGVRPSTVACNCLRLPYLPNPPCVPLCLARTLAVADKNGLQGLGLNDQQTDALMKAKSQLAAVQTADEATSALKASVGEETLNKLKAQVDAKTGPWSDYLAATVNKELDRTRFRSIVVANK